MAIFAAESKMSNGPPPEDDLPPDIGENLRRLRRQQGHSLDSLGKLAGVSRAMLGQIETGKSVPTVTLVWKIANALRVPITSLIQSPRTCAVAHLQRASVPVLSFGEGLFTVRSFDVATFELGVEFVQIAVAPGHREEVAARPPGTRASLAVSSGSLYVTIEGHAVVSAGAGDAILFDADVAQFYSNPGPSVAVAYLVIVPAGAAGR